MTVRVERIGDATLYRGDALEILPTLSGIDAAITDPPYSSGGQFRGDRKASTAAKYVLSDSGGFAEDFTGDNRDQRAFLVWSTLWLGRLHAVSRSGAPLMVFTDWRQLPTTTDAIQCGGWVWRNLVTWWKPGIRMQRGRFSGSSEFIAFGSRGPLANGEQSPQNVLQFAPVGGAEKEHIAEKPAGLMETLVGVTRPGALVADPFMGSGSTGVACVKRGRPFVGVEIDERIFETACRRIADAYSRPRLFPDDAGQAEQTTLLGEAGGQA